MAIVQVFSSRRNVFTSLVEFGSPFIVNGRQIVPILLDNIFCRRFIPLFLRHPFSNLEEQSSL